MCVGVVRVCLYVSENLAKKRNSCQFWVRGSLRGFAESVWLFLKWTREILSSLPSLSSFLTFLTSFISLPTPQSTYSSIHPSFFSTYLLSIHPFIHPFIHLFSIHSFIHSFIHSSFFSFIHPSIYLSIFFLGNLRDLGYRKFFSLSASVARVVCNGGIVASGT